MSKYTTEVRYICENYAGLTESEGYSSINTILEQARSHVFDFEYPIFDENYRSVLEKKILKHYYTREIATETVGLWKHFLDMRMNEIMPYYNQLYSSELLKFDPLYDVDLTTDRITIGNKNGKDTETLEGGSTISANTTNNETHATKNNEIGNQYNKETVTGSKSNTTNASANENVTGKETGSDIKNVSKDGDKTVKTDSETTANSNDKVDTKTTGTITDEGENESTRTDNLTRTSTDSGSDTINGAKIDKNSRWDIYSDTPQGSLQNITLNDGAYLTNARHIIDDGTGSTDTKTTNYGKINTTTDRGTQATEGTDSNTRTMDTKESVDGTHSSIETGQIANEEKYAESGVENSTKVSDKNTTSNKNEERFSNDVENAESINENTNTVDSNSKTNISGSKNASTTASSNSTKTNNHDINTTEDYLQHVKGKRGGISFSKLLLEYRTTFINIDMMIIEELSDLFFGLW